MSFLDGIGGAIAISLAIGVLGLLFLKWITKPPLVPVSYELLMREWNRLCDRRGNELQRKFERHFHCIPDGVNGVDEELQVYGWRMRMQTGHYDCGSWKYWQVFYDGSWCEVNTLADLGAFAAAQAELERSQNEGRAGRREDQSSLA